jgi:hypothetical protein
VLATGKAATTDSAGGATDEFVVATVVVVDARGTVVDVGSSFNGASVVVVTSFDGASVNVGASVVVVGASVVVVGVSVVVVVGGGADTVKVNVCTAARYAPLSAMILNV